MVKQGYKQTEIGVIPEDWDVSTLDNEYDLSAGGDLDISDYSSIKTQKYKYCIYSNGLKNDGIYGYCSNPQYAGNAVTITGRGDIGHCSFREEPFSAIIRLLVCQPKDEISSKFIAEYLKRKKPFVFESTGVPQLTVPQIKSVSIPIPSFSEQQCIAEALSEMDELIASLEKLNAKKKAIKQATMQELLTGKRRLPSFTGEYKKSKIGDLGEFYSGLSGKKKEDFGRGKAKYISFMNVLFNSIIDLRMLESVEVKPNEGQNAVEKGDLFFNTSSETPEEVGMCSALMDTIDNVYLNSFCFGFRLFSNDYDPLYLSYYFNSSVGRRIMYFLAQGATRYNLSKNSFAEIVITIPEKAEQSAIAGVLFDLENDVIKLEQKLTKAHQIKQGMMQQLLTGKIRLV